jgi:glycosyltransferase involved in cell wall biosynthesis
MPRQGRDPAKEGGQRMSASLAKVLMLATHYKGDYHLFNHMVLGLEPHGFQAKVCYMAGTPDGKNSLDRHGKAIYLEDDSQLGGSRIKTILALARLLRNERPHILHCHRFKPTVLGVIAARFSGVPIVISQYHGMQPKHLRRRTRRLTMWLLYRLVNKVITVSEASRRDILALQRSFDPSKVETVWNGIDVGRFEADSAAKESVKQKMGVSADELVFGIVGRLVQKKGHSCLLDAFAEVAKKLHRSRLVIVGDGALREELQKKTENLGLVPKVVFLGRRTEIPELLKGFDVFVLPSVAFF